MIALNHLANETSPYLQQHADNPVDWYPWSQEAFEKAKRENKPVLLSIGYSACHWCHVMAHESFSDQETAQIMNQLFINIKVDREERPDLDKIYQITHQLHTGNPGGWPLTVFLDPKQQLPFFSGTYFPKEPRYQLPSFKELLKKISVAYHEHQQEILSNSQELFAAFENLSKTTLTNATILDNKPWQKAIQKLMSEYDPMHGGFGDSPKFPNPTKIELLLWDNFFSKEHGSQSLEIAFDTLINMANGGIYDHIGGGFYRYAVDNAWEIPHFEKMLYDNAQLLYEYSHAHAIETHPIFFQNVVKETAGWVINEMQSSEGGYYSSIDADSEGREGLFYLWSNDEVQSLLTPMEVEIANLYFNLYENANFENSWHLHTIRSVEEVARKSCESLDSVNQLIKSIKTKLAHVRQMRIFPARDEKILTSWNALMIKAMLFSGARFNQPEWTASAERALTFIYASQWKEGRLLATYKDNKSRFTAYLDDYAFLLDTILYYLQCCWNPQYFLFAQSLAEVLLQHFFDQEHGGFFFTADDHEKLIYRPKTLADEVIPSGNGLACLALQRLGYLLGEQRYLKAVELTLKNFFPIISQYPSEHASLLQTLQEYINPPKLIILRGKNKEMSEWKNALDQHYNLARMIFSLDDEAAAIHSAFFDKKNYGKPVVAYICQGLQCLAPVFDLEELETLK